MKVLIGIDGAAASMAAVEFLGRVLVPTDDEIALYYTPPVVELQSRTAIDPEIVLQVQNSLTDAVFSAARQLLPNGWDAKLETISGTQRPAHGILVAAAAKRADLVVLGARGTSPNGDSGIGSVARHVVHSTPLPVLITRGAIKEAALPRVLLACDGSASSVAAGLLLNRFHWPIGCVGRVMTVVESLLADHLPDWLDEELQKKHGTEMESGFLERTAEELRRTREGLLCQVQDLPEMFRTHEPIVVQGSPAQQILDVAKSEHADLVVVGARRMGTWGRFFHGSTSDNVLVHSAASVLVVRENEKL